MHTRTRACAIPKEVKLIVYERDHERCIFCGAPGFPEAHVIPRSHGGLGVPQNIITVCRSCHDKLDNSTDRQQMLDVAVEYLGSYYPNISQTDVIYQKWDKDKAKRLIKEAKDRKADALRDSEAQKADKDRGNLPQGFEYL
jgi:hypothetical protein